MKPSLPFFVPKKGFYISPESLIGIGLSLILFFTFFLKISLGFNIGNWIIYLAITWGLYVIAFIFTNYFRYEREIGVYNGMIRFGESTISFNDKDYKLENIKKISFRSSDIKGKSLLYLKGISPALSNGLSNSITLELLIGDKVEGVFLQTKTCRLKFYKEILIYYYQENKFSWLHLLDVLEMNDYDEIQLFKNKLSRSNYTKKVANRRLF
ncbi:MAG: hypothetical protein KUG51_01005 [Urechidicola sp.]|nr:hypothetical protein [Urechidicola sp.]